MASAQNPHVHLEAMEEAENQGAKPTEVRHPCVAGQPMGEYPLGLLESSWKWNSQPLYYQRKARTGRVLRLSGAVRANSKPALMRLNRRVPNGMHGGVRGRLLN